MGLYAPMLYSYKFNRIFKFYGRTCQMQFKFLSQRNYIFLQVIITFLETDTTNNKKFYLRGEIDMGFFFR